MEPIPTIESEAALVAAFARDLKGRTDSYIGISLPEHLYGQGEKIVAIAYALLRDEATGVKLSAHETSVRVDIEG